MAKKSFLLLALFLIFFQLSVNAENCQTDDDCNVNSYCASGGICHLSIELDCDKSYYYKDADSDNFGNVNISRYACTRPSGYVANKLDCNDNSNVVSPTAYELCDNLDNDCDNSIDEGCNLFNPGQYFSSATGLLYYGTWSNYVLAGDQDSAGLPVKYSTTGNSKLTFKIKGNKFVFKGFKGTAYQGQMFGKIKICINEQCSIYDTYLSGIINPERYSITFSNLNSGINNILINNEANKLAIFEGFEVYGSVCGNAIPEDGEQCDDGNNINTDSCLTTCKIAMCNDGFVQAGVEQCDNGPGMADQCFPSYGTSCTYCSEQCSLIEIIGPKCGDKFIQQPYEECDDGTEINSILECPYGTQTCILCNSECRLNSAIGTYCGDMVVNGRETCDSWAADCIINGYGGLKSCKSDCTGYSECIPNQGCGDGRLQGNEMCDDGNNNGLDGCSPICITESGWICQDNICTRNTCEREGKCGNYPDCSEKKSFYEDLDSDGYGNPQKIKTECMKPEGYVNNSQDCDDENRFNHLGNNEICDGLDNDCNMQIDDSLKLPFCYSINSKYSPLGVCMEMKTTCNTGVLSCETNEKYVVEETKDNCDGLDNDCDGTTDEECACSPGESKDCGTNIGECSHGKQECKTDGTWGDCIDEIKPAAETCDGLDNDCDNYVDEDVKEECLLEGCPGYKLCKNGKFDECFAQCSDKSTVTMELDQYDLKNMMDEAKLAQSEKSQALKTLSEVEQSTNFQYQTGKTRISSTLETDKSINGLEYTLYIPKCLSPYLSQIKFDNPNYTIIKEDPIIAWHFVEVKDRIDLSYEVDGRISEQCMEKIKGLPIADFIGKAKKKFDPKSLILPLCIIALALIITFMPKKMPKKNVTEKDYEEDFIQKQREKYSNQVKSMGFKSRQQAEHYLTELGLGEEDKANILDKLRF